MGMESSEKEWRRFNGTRVFWSITGKVIDQWGTDIIYGCVVTDHWNNHRNYFGTDPCTLP